MVGDLSRLDTRVAGRPTRPAVSAQTAIMKLSTYRLTFENRSNRAGSVCLYQTHPELGRREAWPLAWFARYNYPTTRVEFHWRTEYCFFWHEAKSFRGGRVMSQTWPADPKSSNHVTLTRHRAYGFCGLKASRRPGRLLIQTDGTLPLRQAWAGIGMSGSGLFAVPVQPNLDLAFTLHPPEYWLTFGNYRQGDRLDLARIANPVRLKFLPNCYTMSAILQVDNTWRVEPISWPVPWRRRRCLVRQRVALDGG